MKFFTDQIKPSGFRRDDVTGFLRAPVTLARVGVQHYYGHELGLDNRRDELIGVYRPENEVSARESVATFVNLPGTDGHPTEPVTVDNIKELQIGAVSGAVYDAGVLSGDALITDIRVIDRVIQAREAGESIEISVGYSCDELPETGEYDGEKYEFVQRNIKANHWALVPHGRCGSACKIHMDEGVKTMKITVDGVGFETENSALVQAIEKSQKLWADERKELQDKAAKYRDQRDTQAAEVERVKAERDAAKAEVLTEDKLAELVKTRAQVIADGRVILGDSFPDCDDCPVEIKTAVVEKVLKTDCAGKPAAYLDAAYDIAIKRWADTKQSMDALGESFGKPETQQRTDARAEYIKNTLKAI